jgi:hypothetical protein
MKGVSRWTNLAEKHAFHYSWKARKQQMPHNLRLSTSEVLDLKFELASWCWWGRKWNNRTSEMKVTSNKLLAVFSRGPSNARFPGGLYVQQRRCWFGSNMLVFSLIISVWNVTEFELTLTGSLILRSSRSKRLRPMVSSSRKLGLSLKRFLEGGSLVDSPCKTCKKKKRFQMDVIEFNGEIGLDSLFQKCLGVTRRSIGCDM